MRQRSCHIGGVNPGVCLVKAAQRAWSLTGAGMIRLLPAQDEVALGHRCDRPRRWAILAWRGEQGCFRAWTFGEELAAYLDSEQLTDRWWHGVPDLTPR